MAGDEMVQLNLRVPRATREAAKEKLDHGGLSREVRKRLEEIAHGYAQTERERVKDQLDSLRDDRDDLKRQRREIDREIDEKETKISRLEERLSELQNADAEYEATLDSLVETVEDGRRIFIGHPTVERAAELGGRQQETVLDEVKDRAADTVPEEMFEEGSPNNITGGDVFR